MPWPLPWRAGTSQGLRLRRKEHPNSLEIKFSHLLISRVLGKFLAPLQWGSKDGMWAGFSSPGTDTVRCPSWWSCSPSALCAQWVGWKFWPSPASALRGLCVETFFCLEEGLLSWGTHWICEANDLWSLVGLMWNGTVIWATRSANARDYSAFWWSGPYLHRDRDISLNGTCPNFKGLCLAAAKFGWKVVTWHCSPDPLLLLDRGGSLQSMGEKVVALAIWRTLTGKSQLQPHPAAAKHSRACVHCPRANRSLVSQWVQASWNARKWGFFLSNPGLEEILRGIKENVEDKNRR